VEKHFYTFLIFPGAQGKLRKIQVPFYLTHVLAGLCLVGVIALGALINSYARMLLKVSNYNDVRSEREALKTQYRTLENVVSQTNAKLDSLQSLAAEVALTYGFGDAQRPRFPNAVLSLAAQSNSTVESSYRASLYAFNLMKTATVAPVRGPVARGIVFDPDIGTSSITIPSIWPVRGQITGGFGERMDPLSGEDAFHSGVDISAPRGSEVEAAADGVVICADRESGYGKEIVLDHGAGVTTRYGHLGQIYIVLGQQVRRGQIIGAVGTTGKTTGPHLHYEVRVNQAPVNPAKFLRG
jgi:murein DD-endopeptidase MepM/ murein hydrolase activator NlpD